MYKAQIYWTRGLGYEIPITITQNSNHALEERIIKVTEWIKGKHTFLGKECNGYVEKILYSYPSGKKFLKKF